jgi:hypothetical protein
MNIQGAADCTINSVGSPCNPIQSVTLNNSPQAIFFSLKLLLKLVAVAFYIMHQVVENLLKLGLLKQSQRRLKKE